MEFAPAFPIGRTVTPPSFVPFAEMSAGERREHLTRIHRWRPEAWIVEHPMSTAAEGTHDTDHKLASMLLTPNIYPHTHDKEPS